MLIGVEMTLPRWWARIGALFTGAQVRCLATVIVLSGCAELSLLGSLIKQLRPGNDAVGRWAWAQQRLEYYRRHALGLDNLKRPNSVVIDMAMNITVRISFV